jgi:hypothetical protein
MMYLFQVPMSDGWEQITEGMKVEVVNHDCDLSYTVYWIASVVKLAGSVCAFVCLLLFCLFVCCCFFSEKEKDAKIES